MAVFTRINGDAAGQVNVDAGRAFANAAVINTGIASPIQFYKIAGFTSGNLAAELTTGGAVETILRIVEGNATVLAYQVDATPQISIITERSGWVSDAALQTAIQSANGQFPSTGGNIGATGNVWMGTSVTAASSGGFKLA
jgi:hypothetical protein